MMTIADKAAEIKAALDKGGEEFGPEEVIEEALERRLRRHLLAELADEDEEPGERLMRRRLRRRMLAELFDEDEEPGERLMRRGLRRHLLAEFFDGGPIDRRMRRRAARRAAFKPKADIFEHDGMLVIKAELPGVKKEDVEITVDEGDLVISGERQAEPAIKDEDYYQGETMHGRFYRRLPLPAGVKLEQIKADHKDGVLEIRVPMPARPKVALA
jgi:HSP20 family protein